MRIRPDELAAIRAGTVDVGFRRWDRPRVVVGTRMRTAVGLVEVTAVEPVDESALTGDDARRAGAASLDALRRGLADPADRPVFRVGLRWAGEDPRIALRQRPPTPDELAAIRARLDRLDAASAIGAWTRATLRAIDRSPEVRAPDLAAALGRDTASFKRDVRKLKELGLTESLDIGYRLSPRGEAVLDDGGPARARPGRLVRVLTGKGVRVEFVKESLTFTGEDSPMANLLLSVMGAFAEFERSLILERQREGIAAAKARGVYVGRKPALTPEQAAQLRERAAAGESKAALARELGISRETVYSYLRVPNNAPGSVIAVPDSAPGADGVLAALPVDTRPLPDFTRYDDLLPSRRSPSGTSVTDAAR